MTTEALVKHLVAEKKKKANTFVLTLSVPEGHRLLRGLAEINDYYDRQISDDMYSLSREEKENLQTSRQYNTWIAQRILTELSKLDVGIYGNGESNE